MLSDSHEIRSPLEHITLVGLGHTQPSNVLAPLMWGQCDIVTHKEHLIKSNIKLGNTTPSVRTVRIFNGAFIRLIDPIDELAIH